MQFSVVTPQALWLLLLLPLTAALALAGTRRPNPRRFWMGLAIRLSLMTMLILALAGAQLRLRSDLLTVVFVLDASDSLPPEQIQAGEDFIAAAIQALETGDQAAVVVFGQDALVDRLPETTPLLAELTSTPMTTASDIAGALQLALALFPDEGARRIVLLSDGQQTIGQAMEQAELAAAQDAELTFVPLGGPPGEREVLVERLEAPTSLRLGQELELRGVVNAQQAVSATVRLFGDGNLIEARPVQLAAGENVLRFLVQPEQAGFRRYALQITPEVDDRLQNNQADAFSVVFGPPQILLVEGTAGEAAPLAAALQAAEMDVTTVTPQALPTDLPALAAFDAVVLINTPAEELPEQAMPALQSMVRDLGKGLLMVGGADSYGAGGYLRTELEDTLPVDMDVRSREQTPNLALVLAVDKSGSMGRCHCDDPDLAQEYDRVEVGQPKVDIAKAAILMASTALGSQDYLGVVAFDESPRWAVETQQLIDAVSLENSIGGIAAEGGTNVQSGVQAAYDSLQASPARIKHVILLTDGWTSGGDLLALANKMESEGITLSVIAAGGGSAEYLEELARNGGGRYYAAEDILSVPEFFLQETVQAAGRYIIEEPFLPIPVDAANPVLRGLSPASLPALLGYNGSTLKDTARIILATPAGDPLLASWQYGLGRAAAWTSDLKGQWASQWLDWEGFPRFAAQLIGSVLPAAQVEGLITQVEVIDGAAQISLEARDEAGLPLNLLDVTASLVDPDGIARQVTLQQVGAGLYRAEVPLDQAGVYLAQITASQDGQPIGQSLAGVVAPYSPEYRRSGVNRPLLESLAIRTGGGQLLAPQDALDRQGLVFQNQAQQIWQALLLAAALLFPLDVAIRRVLINGSDVRQGLAGLVQRIRRKPAGVEERVEELSALQKARQRSRTRMARPSAPPAKPESRETSKANESQAEGSQVTPDGDTSTPDTLERLRQAKQRRKNRP